MIEELQIGAREAVATMTESQRYSLESVEIANRAGERLGSVTSRIGEIDSMNQSVATATEEQTAVVDSLNMDITEINTLNQEGVESCGGLWTTDTGSPIVIRGKDKLAEHAVWSLKCFPDWEWYNINIFGTDDPNHFWVECDGHGKILFPGYPEGYYENHFLHSFELEDGKIKRNREFMNVFQQLRVSVAAA